MKKLAPQNWVVILYHLISVTGILIVWYNYWEMNAAFVKSLLLLAGSVLIIALTILARTIPLWFAWPFYLLISLVIITPDLNWGDYTIFDHNFSEEGSSFFFGSQLTVVLGYHEYDELGFIEKIKGLNLIPLAICILTQWHPKPKENNFTNEQLLDENFNN